MATKTWTWDEKEHGWAALAAYTSVRSLPGELMPAPEAALAEAALAEDSSSTQARLEIARRLYEQIAEQDWDYVYAPFSDRGQLLRDPIQIRTAKAATCLDIAMLYATMAKAAGLRPRLAVLDNEISRHAVVLISRDRRSNWSQPVQVWTLPYADWDNYWAVDVSAALTDAQSLEARAGSWAEALRSGGEHFQAAEGDFDSDFEKASKCHVIDVLTANEVHPEVEPLPSDELRPAIYQMLPSLGVPIELREWQQDVVDEALAVAENGGYLIIAGPSGMGKTAAALRPAYRVAHGSGWLLNAADDVTLRRSFAQAEVNSRPQSADIPPEGLTSQALARLATSGFPWVVILDGADHPDGPQHYAGLIPTPDRGQLVLITTSRIGEWKQWRAQDRDQDRVRVLVVPSDAVSPLIAALGGSESDDPDDVGSLVAARINELRPREQQMARVLGWTPPLSAPKPEDMTEREAAAIYRAMVSAGLVDSSSRIMHRKVREAIRSGVAGPPDIELLTNMIRAYPRAFSAEADRQFRRDLIAILSDAPDPGRADSGMLAMADALTRDEASEAAKIYKRLLNRMGWTLEGWVPANDTQAIRTRKCLEGVARWKYRQKDPLAAQEAEELALAGLKIPVLSQDGRVREQQDLRLRALRQLARRTQIGNSNESAELKRAAYEQLIADFQEMYLQRKAMMPKHLDVARSLFNLPGTRISLAKLLDPPDSAVQYRKALEEYEEVYELRREAFGTDDLDDVAACLNGQAVALYYLALSDPNLTVRERNQYLGRAAQMAARAMASRQIAQWSSSGVGKAVADSAAILHKVVLTVLQVHEVKNADWGPKASGEGQLAEVSGLLMERLVPHGDD